jgi:hypothetical protein
MVAQKRTHDCPSCRCGMIEISWGNHRMSVRPDDHDTLTSLVVACALDDFNESTETGVPDGFDKDVEAQLVRTVAVHLSAAEPHWMTRTVQMTAAQRRAFEAEVRATLKRPRAG